MEPNLPQSSYRLVNGPNGLQPVSSKPLQPFGYEQYQYPLVAETPDEVLGVRTEPLINLAHAIGHIAYLAKDNISATSTARESIEYTYFADDILSLFPLVARYQAGDEIGVNEQRPFYPPMIRVATKTHGTHGWLKIPKLRNYFESCKKPEVMFPDAMDKFFGQAEDSLPSALPVVELLEEIDNPRRQFVEEITIVADVIHDNAIAHSRSDRQSDIVNASDAGYGIYKFAEDFLTDRYRSRQQFKLLTKFILDKVQVDYVLPGYEDCEDILGIISPDIISALYSVIPSSKQDLEFLDSISAHPHAPFKAWAAEQFMPLKMSSVRATSRLLLPSIRDLLPTQGTEVRAIFERFRHFIAAKKA